MISFTGVFYKHERFAPQSKHNSDFMVTLSLAPQSISLKSALSASASCVLSLTLRQRSFLKKKCWKLHMKRGK